MSCTRTWQNELFTFRAYKYNYYSPTVQIFRFIKYIWIIWIAFLFNNAFHVKQQLFNLSKIRFFQALYVLIKLKFQYHLNKRNDLETNCYLAWRWHMVDLVGCRPGGCSPWAGGAHARRGGEVKALRPHWLSEPSQPPEPLVTSPHSCLEWEGRSIIHTSLQVPTTLLYHRHWSIQMNAFYY